MVLFEDSTRTVNDGVEKHDLFSWRVVFELHAVPQQTSF